MHRILLIALLFAAPAASDEKPVVRFRLRKDPSVQLRGRVVAYDHDRFVLQAFGGGAKRELLWSDVQPDDAARLRRALGLELGPADDTLEFVPGHEIRFKGGHVIEGLLVRVDENDRHWIKRDGVTLPYPGDRIAKVKEIELPERDIYDPDEIYTRRLLRRPPANAREHVELANYLYDIGAFEQAKLHYSKAAAQATILATTTAPRIARIEEYLADEHAAAVFRKAKRLGVLHGDFEGAVALVERFVKDHPEFARQGIRLTDEIRERREAQQARRFQRVKHEAVDRAVERFLRTRKPTLAEALAWVRTEMPKAVRKRVRRRLSLAPDDYERLLAAKSEARGAPHWATYKDGTFVVAKRGGDREAAESWWRRYGDATTHVPFLKAYAAEKLPDLFEVTRVRFTDCTRCGGRGHVRKMEFRSSRGAGTNEWKELCPRCHGQRRDRAVAYR